MLRRVLVFGTFDGLDSGHLFFLKNAEREGDELFVSVARDVQVKDLKNKFTKLKQQDRLEAIRTLQFVKQAELSDEKLGSFDVINKLKPDVIALGFDQIELEKSLKSWMLKNKNSVQIVYMKKYEQDMG
jgi:FAD synthetase